jgi:predicted hydrocarbon binding protein
MSYIERETALQIIDNYAKTVSKDGKVVVDAVRDVVAVITPTADTVEVVRCRNCAKDGLSTCPICYIEKQALIFINHDPDFYCAYGERRGENAT